MIYLGQLTQLMNVWKGRLGHTSNNFDYKVALSECLHELEETVDKTLDSEADGK